MKKLRVLNENDVELRLAQKFSNGRARYLLYINSRTAQTLLDETFKPENWNVTYRDIAGFVFCHLEIYDEDSKKTIIREDVGSEKQIEPGKSIVSDALKRCISRVGWIDLYSAPEIVLQEDYGYTVSKLDVNEDHKITHITIVNKAGDTVFSWNLGNKVEPVKKADNSTVLKEFCGKLKVEPGANIDELKKFYAYYNPKAAGWKGNFDIKQLWENWLKRVA